MLNIPDNDPRILALKSDNYTWAGLVQIDFNAGMERLSPTTDSDIRVDGKVWTSNPDLLTISPVSAERAPNDSQDIHETTFADPVREGMPRRWVDLLVDDGSYVGTPIWVGIALIYNRKWTQSFTLYRGQCIGVVSGNGETGQITTATWSGPLVRLDSNPKLVLTASNLSQRNPTDAFLDFISISRNLPFGKLANT